MNHQHKKGLSLTIRRSLIMRLRTRLPLLALIVCSMVFAGNRTLEDLKQLKGFTVKPGAESIAPLNSPEYVPAAQSNMPDNAWIIGLQHNGETRAYSMNLLNMYFVVNDQIGDQPFVLFWDPMANSAVAYNSNVDGKKLNFSWPAALYHSAMVFTDGETSSYWAGVTGDALGGDMQGKTLQQLPILTKTVFGDWKNRHPNTTVASVQGKSHDERNPYSAFILSPDPLMAPVETNKALPPKMSVFAMNHEGKAYAIAHPAAEGGWKGKAGKTQVFFFRPPKAPPYYGTIAYDLEGLKLKKKKDVWTEKSLGDFDPITGTFEKGDKKLARLNGADTFWYVWTGYHPKPKLLNPPRRQHSEFKTETAASINAGDDPTKRN